MGTISAKQVTSKTGDPFVVRSAQPDDAAKLIAIGESAPDEVFDPIELAANTLLANVLLNLDEAVSKENSEYAKSDGGMFHL